jgi:hypothetical protein
LYKPNRKLIDKSINKIWGGGCELNSFHSRQGPMAGSSEHSTELSGSIKKKK